MKADLGYKRNDTLCQPCAPEKSESKTIYPCLRMELTDENKDLLKKIPMEGSATIHFRTKSLRIGEDYDPNSEGCIELEIHSIDLPDKGKPMVGGDSAQSLDDYMARQKKGDDEEDEDE